MISHEHQCIFIHIPKCAGTSVERALGHLDGHTGRGGQDHRSIRMIQRPFLTLKMLSSVEQINTMVKRVVYPLMPVMNPKNRWTVSREQFDSYYKFTFVRNPWARAYSWYKNVIRDELHLQKYKISSDISLAEFLRRFGGKGELRPQLYWLKTFQGSVSMDFIGRFESLAQDYEKVALALKLETSELPHEIKGSGSNYRDHYDSQSKELVAKIYREDVETFGYTFES